MSLGMRRYQEVRDEMLPRSPFLTIALVDQPGETRRIGVDVVVGDGKRSKRRQKDGGRVETWRYFGKNHRTDAEFPLFRP